ncbi:unnamed protein product [Microthlaspi erraticum]|uniref:RBR-type E3 ubiquitin transferase n=1 Tax=Microthlaspi erraticum TaxID=1685480 RepID=A0A6D2JCR8_9BRAS|nr:unnamed protein product [Microthlaspi erraticum]
MEVKATPKSSMEIKLSEIVIIDMPGPRETCSICTDDNMRSNQMFSVDICHHRFCSECVKRHLEVRLLEGLAMTCPHDGCQSKLSYINCIHLLTPKLKEFWRQKMREDLIPVAKRVYCPNPRCSALMSETELSISKPTDEAMRFCVRCHNPFCISCKVPWHSNLSCEDYKSLHPNPTESERKLKALANQKRWRQCGKCQNMVELSQGCVSVVCR